MSDVRASTPNTRSRRGRSRTPQQNAQEQSAIWGELQLFLAGLDAHRVPNEEEAECRIWMDVSQVLDHDLIEALKLLYKHYINNPPLDDINSKDIERIWPVQNLIDLLEQYQKSRLRTLLDAAHGMLKSS